MGGIITPSKEEELLKYLRQDDPKNLQKFLVSNKLGPDMLYTNRKRTLLQLTCYFESPKCASKLLEMNYDYNQKELLTGNTPLYIACQFNCLDIVAMLLSQEDCNKLVKNKENLNEFDIAFLKGNYSVCYYLLYIYKDKKVTNDNNKITNPDNNNIENDNNKISNININANLNKVNNNYDINQVYQKYLITILN